MRDCAPHLLHLNGRYITKTHTLLLPSGQTVEIAEFKIAPDLLSQFGTNKLADRITFPEVSHDDKVDAFIPFKVRNSDGSLVEEWDVPLACPQCGGLGEVGYCDPDDPDREYDPGDTEECDHCNGTGREV